MAENLQDQTTGPSKSDVQLEGGTYEIIRNRLLSHSKELRDRVEKLNVARKDVFGSIEHKLTGSERISTSNNCVPRDMVPVDHRFLFGYNVFIGLRSGTALDDVFAVYSWKDSKFTPCPLDLINSQEFEADFQNLYKYYRETAFSKFAVIGPHLYMVFRVGKSVSDIKTFKWLINQDSLTYLDNRSDHEYVFPPQHEFSWKRVSLDMHHSGKFPHISIDDRVFVETIGGDLTIKVEDNTETGEGIYSEPVDNPDQTLDDAEIHYAIVGNIIILKIRPYQEKDFRYIVFNEKIQKAVRIDSIADACVLLPEGHGLIFPKGYYLQTGEYKKFDNELEDLLFEKRLASPNGEDYLYVFFNRESGTYVLLSYNMIEQVVQSPIVCNGYSLFDDGTLTYFRADDEAQKHHVIQIWQTPFCGPDHEFSVNQDSYLFKIGNKDIVRCMAECTELLALIQKEDTYANLYIDIAKKSQDICDSYFWLDSSDTFTLIEPLREISAAASSAIDEFEKVVRTKRNTNEEIARVSGKVGDIIKSIDYYHLTDISMFVTLLAQLRQARGEVISLKDLRYADLSIIETLENELAQHIDKLSGLCVDFLLTDEALQPYQTRVTQQQEALPELQKVTHAQELSENLSQTSNELEMLIEIVSNLNIDDATKTTAIIDNISLVLSQLNGVKSSLKNKINELASIEGKAEFTSQMKLIDQAVVNYLDISDTPNKCDEYLTKVSSQLETLESRFADFDEFILVLTEKREEVYNAFESRKVQLVEQRNRRASTLMTSAERILKGITNRAKSFSEINELNGYFASDLMIERIRETISRLEELGDAVKAEDIQSRLKQIQQDAVRQLKDKKALFEDGDDIIRFGEHRFVVNHQPLELTIVPRQDKMFFHLTGTGFFEQINDPKFLETRDVWSMEVTSESPDVYRGEYLAFKMLQELNASNPKGLSHLVDVELAELTGTIQKFMAPRYTEGYVKGVHDVDASRILQALIRIETQAGLLRYSGKARTLGRIFWLLWDNEERKSALHAKITAAGHMQKLLANSNARSECVSQLRDSLQVFLKETKLFDAALTETAADYLFDELAADNGFSISKNATELRDSFTKHLKSNKYTSIFEESVNKVAGDPYSMLYLLRDWVTAYVTEHADKKTLDHVDEAASLLLPSNGWKQSIITAETSLCLTDMVGSHDRVQQASYELDYSDFTLRLRHHEQTIVPKYQQYQKVKADLIDRFSSELRLDEFKPKVLSSFVRNKLIDNVYLKLIGDNLAKQIGAAGDQKRTDRQGLLLLISPPGYGKTTLMAYLANRLGLIFMKINGPAIGHRVTSLDPSEAPNAAAREELEKLNLAFEMGDNVMIYLDDIQHCNPELLQKFISMCDAQRRIEGVYKGKTKTYDLTGKRACVVMAGNPYTESGEKFRIPDMLTNRADTYNIGDIVGDNYDDFVLSYLENSLTSNPVLNKLATRSQSDVYAIIQLARTGQRDGLEFEGNYGVDELNEYVSTFKKLFVVQDVVLKVNQQYIRSAGQSEEYRTEPPFLLQGSYRNMNRIAGKVLPLLNDDELWTLIQSSYEQDAQTLTSSAEANLLKFKELTGRLSEADSSRWEEIKKTFGRNKLFGGPDEDKVTMVVRQLSGLGSGLDSIKDVISNGMESLAQPARKTPEESPLGDLKDVSQQVLNRMNDLIDSIRQQSESNKDNSLTQTIATNSNMLLSVLEEQFQTMELWLEPVVKNQHGRKEYIEDLLERFETMTSGYNRLMEILRSKQKNASSETQTENPANEDA